MARKITRAGFKAWLQERWNKTVGVQEDPHACAIAQYILERVPNASKPDVCSYTWGYWDGETRKWVSLPSAAWQQRVIGTFDELKGVPTGADLLKALKWTHSK